MRQNTYRPRRSRLRAAANILLMLSTVIAFGGGVAALLSLAGCDATWSLRAPAAVVVVDRMQASQPDEVHAASTSITPITTLSASRPTELGGSTTGSLYASADFIDIIAKSGSTATLNLVYYDTTAAAWAVYGTSCAVTTDLSACRYVAKRGQFYWHVYKSTGSTSGCYIEQVNRGSAALGSIEPAQAGGLTNVSVSSPLSGDGTSGSPITLGTVPASAGGTGQSTIAPGDLLIGAGGNTLSKLAIGASGRALISDGTTAAWTAINTLPAPGTAGRVLYDTGSAWAGLAVGSSGQVLQTNGSGAAPSWVWLTEGRHLFTNATTNNVFFGQGVNSSSQGRDVRAVRILASGTINYVSLTALNITAGPGTVTVQLYVSTDGNTWAAVSGASRTISTSVTGSLTDSGALSDINVTAGEWYLAKVVGYSSTTIASLAVIIRGGGGAKLALHLGHPANDNAHAERMVA